MTACRTVYRRLVLSSGQGNWRVAGGERKDREPCLLSLAGGQSP